MSRKAAPAPGDLATAVAKEIQTLIGGRQMSGIDLAARIGRSQNYVAMQFRGEAAFSLRGLEEICAALALNPATVICDAQARTSGEAAAT